MRKKYIIRFIIAFVICYILGYLFARKNQWIVHSVVRDNSNRYMEHSVISGDGMFLGAIFKGYTTALYSPLRFLEVKYWYMQQPIGTDLSDEHMANLEKHKQ